ncbi:hypothetical protein QTV49_004779 [Vibrio vulnificus]|nr:hypothetical protein [Vibrio vulnificus]
MPVSGLPAALQHIFHEKQTVTLDRVYSSLKALAIDIICIEKMKEPNNDLTPLDGYKLAKTSGMESLEAICIDFLSGSDTLHNGARVASIHVALRPFFKTKLTQDTLDKNVMANELLRVHADCELSLIEKYLQKK